MKLLCKEYGIRVLPNESPAVQAVFLLPVNPQDTKAVAEALKNVASFMGQEIEMVRARDGWSRCFYCAQLNDEDALECRKCGAPML